MTWPEAVVALGGMLLLALCVLAYLGTRGGRS